VSCLLRRSIDLTSASRERRFYPNVIRGFPPQTNQIEAANYAVTNARDSTTQRNRADAPVRDNDSVLAHVA
jgi:hypothetical protein